MRSKRCRNCDLDGEIWDGKNGGYIKCPYCLGTRKIEVEKMGMSENQFFQYVVWSCACMAALCGLGAVGLIIVCATSFSIGVLMCSLLLTAGAIGSGGVAVTYAGRAQAPTVFNNQDEKEVLTNKQRKILKHARGEVVMERALIEVEHERANIVHNLELEAADPDVPPHETRWTNGVRNALPRSFSREKD